MTGALTEGPGGSPSSPASARPARPAIGAGWFADWALDGLADSFPGNADLVLRATLDPRLQAVAEARLEALLAGPGARAGVGQGAVVVLDAGTGAVRAMVGGRDYRDSQFNRAADARRQPGSAFKPFVFLAALEAGMRPEEAVADGPLTLGGWSPGNGAWRPRGEITRGGGAGAQRQHRRRPGAAAGRRAARGDRGGAAAGLDGRFPNDASLALGTGEVALLDLAAAYRRLRQWRAAGGAARHRAAAAGDGRALPVPRAPPRRVMAAGACRGDAADAGGGGVARHRPRRRGLPGRVVAGKTGTTQEFRDAWFIGFVGRGGSASPLVIGVWLGNDDGRPMDEVAAARLPARLFREIAEAAVP